MKAITYITLILMTLSSCDVQVSLEMTNTRFNTITYQGQAICDQHISLNGTNMIITIDRPYDDEDVEINLGDGLSFDGTLEEDGVIVLDSRTRQRLSNSTSFRLINGELEPGFINDYDLIFNVSENGGQRGKCTVELDRN